MNHKVNRYVDLALGVLFLLTCLSGCVGGEGHDGRLARQTRAQRATLLRLEPAARGTADPAHVLTGGLLLAGVTTHLILHANWIRGIVLRRPAHLAPRARVLRTINILLGGALAACACSGLAAWLAPAWPWNLLHHLSLAALWLLLAAHLALHVRRMST